MLKLPEEDIERIGNLSDPDHTDPFLNMVWEDEEAILDQMERMGGGNLIGRPSPYDKK